MSEREVRAFAPASVSNVGCGFDAFGFAIAGLGDEVTVEIGEHSGVEIVAIHGDDGRLPREALRNTAGLAAQAALERVRHHAGSAVAPGVRLTLHKNMPLSSGLGSSAASAVAAAVAVDALFEAGLEREELLRCALAGERLASGAEHADNVAPSLLGGFVLVRALHPRPDLIALPVPEGLSCALVRPHVGIDTLEARRLLGDRVELGAAVRQWANTAALVAALWSGDLELLARSLEDAIAEPVRSPLVPGFDVAKAAALDAGALGCSLSGSGPTLFALTADLVTADGVASAMHAALAAEGVAADRWVSPVGSEGARRSSAARERPLEPSVEESLDPCG